LRSQQALECIVLLDERLHLINGVTKIRTLQVCLGTVNQPIKQVKFRKQQRFTRKLQHTEMSANVNKRQHKVHVILCIHTAMYQTLASWIVLNVWSWFTSTMATDTTKTIATTRLASWLVLKVSSWLTSLRNICWLYRSSRYCFFFCHRAWSRSRNSVRSRIRSSI